MGNTLPNEERGISGVAAASALSALLLSNPADFPFVAELVYAPHTHFVDDCMVRCSVFGLRRWWRRTHTSAANASSSFRFGVADNSNGIGWRPNNCRRDRRRREWRVNCRQLDDIERSNCHRLKQRPGAGCCPGIGHRRCNINRRREQECCGNDHRECAPGSDCCNHRTDHSVALDCWYSGAECNGNCERGCIHRSHVEHIKCNDRDSECGWVGHGCYKRNGKCHGNIRLRCDQIGEYSRDSHRTCARGDVGRCDTARRISARWRAANAYRGRERGQWRVHCGHVVHVKRCGRNDLTSRSTHCRGPRHR